MKKIILLMTIVLVSGVAFAQPRNNRQPDKDPKARAEQRTERMTKDLSLTDKQKQQVLTLNLKQAEEMQSFRSEAQEMRANNKGVENKDQKQSDRQKMQEERLANKTAYNAKLKSILTQDQYTKYLEQQSQRKDKCKDCSNKQQKQNKGKKQSRR